MTVWKREMKNMISFQNSNMSELIQMAEDIAKVKSIAIKSAEKISTLEERCERLQTTLNWFLSGHSITLPVEQTSGN